VKRAQAPCSNCAHVDECFERRACRRFRAGPAGIQAAALFTLLALVLALLSGCGGGDADEDDQATTPAKPQCTTNPELCK
jgi:hypothetical protein